MTGHNYLTIHTLTALPWHNLNRDERGIPKQVIQGGVSRGVLSSQSLKRAARVRYELDAADVSLRSRLLAENVVVRATELADERGVVFDEKAALKLAKKTIAQLTAKDDPDKVVKAAEKHAAAVAKAEKAGQPAPDVPALVANADVVAWLSADELDTLALFLVESSADPTTTDFIADGAVPSLAIAAFGRMFANAPTSNTEAAIAVSPAVTTHEINIEVDYFTAADDLALQGAAHLAQSFHTTGTYYRSVTIDRAQLRRSWSGFDAPDAIPRLTLLLRSIILALPTGKRNASAADIAPALILTEQQTHRTSYSFEQPVEPAGLGGHLVTSAAELIRQATNARAFDPEQFAETLVSGTEPELACGFADELNLPDLVNRIVDWVLA